MTTDDLQLPETLRRALDEMVQRIVEVARPQAVILFGSYAEGRAKAHSDFDFLVITDVGDPRDVGVKLYIVAAEMARGRTDEYPPTDFIVLTPEEYAHEVQLPGLVVWQARRTGVIVYGQAA